MLASFSLLPPDSPWLPLIIYFARITDVSIGTFRVISVTRGHRYLAAFLGFFEVSIWILAASQVIVHLDHWVNLLAYAGGFSTGNIIGMWIEQRVALGIQTLMFISRGKAHAVAERLRFAGFVVTTLAGSGRDGPVSVGLAVVPRKLTPGAFAAAREIDPDVILTVQDVRSTTIRPTTLGVRGLLPSSFTPPAAVQILQPAAAKS